MKWLILLTLVLLTTTRCAKSNYQKETPVCIQTKINSFQNNCCEKDANVKKYIFQEKIVFVFDPGTCGADMTSEVVDENCNTLGYLGGFIGNSKINNENFSNAVLKSTIWKK